jgi:hypothetical protein
MMSPRDFTENGKKKFDRINRIFRIRVIPSYFSSPISIQSRLKSLFAVLRASSEAGGYLSLPL